jgi:hypothetical protein
MIKWLLVICFCCGLLTGRANPGSPVPADGNKIEGNTITRNPDYDHLVIEQVSQTWFGIMDSIKIHDKTAGKVIVQFTLYSDGTTSDVKNIKSEVSDLRTAICDLAIVKSRPFPKWSPEIAKKLGANSCDVIFTFVYK